MSDLYDETDDWREEDDSDREPDDDWRDDDCLREPDPEDAEIARAYEEEAEHREMVHGGGECTCRPSLRTRASYLANDIANRLTGPWYRLKAASRQPWTLRIGTAELTVRLHANQTCGACRGKGWLYTLSGAERDPIPPGYNGAALYGCGSAIRKLAETRRYLRSTSSEPPF